MGRHSLCGSSGAGSERGASRPLPSLHRERSLERRRLTVAGVRVAAMRGCGSGEGFGARAAWHTGAYVEEQRVLHLTWERCAACGSGRGRVGRGQCVEARLPRAKGHVMDSSRSTLVGLEVFLVRALVVGWWRAMHSSAALMSECVGSWGLCGELGARAPAFCGAGCGERQGARAPPRPLPRDATKRRCSTHGDYRPCTTSTRRTPWTWPKRPTRGREVFWLCVGLQRHPQPASKRASAARLPARGGGARSAAAIAPPGGARGAAPRVCVC